MSFSIETHEPRINWGNVFHCAPDWQMAKGWSDNLRDFDLWYVWAGLGQLKTEDGVFDLRPGRGVLMRPGRRYEATQRPDALLHVTAIHFDLWRNGRRVLPSRVAPPVEVFDAASPDFMTDALEHITVLYNHRKQSELANALLKAVLLEILSSTKTSNEETALQRYYKEVILSAQVVVRSDLSHRFTIDELAAKSGYTTDHFVRVFRSVTGQSPSQWIIAQRMERAVALLRESSHTVTQIADQLGYDDLAFFSRQFKKTMGVSPDQFRRR